jgi:hypothetical protein
MDGISSGKELDAKSREEFLLASVSKNALVQIQANSTPEVVATIEPVAPVVANKDSANTDLNALLADMGCKTIEA